MKKDGFSLGALQLPASPKAKNLSEAGAELCLGLRVHKTKTSVLEEWWGGREGYMDEDNMVMVDTEG